MTNTDLPVMVKAQPITVDFLLSQTRLALVAVLAYGGGAHWFTPEQAGLYMALFTSLGPVAIPWVWSIFANFGKVFVSVHSAAAVVARVETTDKVSATAGATSALIANSGKAAIIAAVCAFSLFAFAGPSHAQVKLTGNLVKDFGPKTSAAPVSSAPVDNALASFGDSIQKIEKAVVDKGIADLNSAITDATNHNDNISLPCWQANLKLLQSLPSQWEAPPGLPMGIALTIQVQRDLMNSITGNEAGSLKVACAALWGDQLRIVANVGALIGLRVASGGLF